MPPGIGYAGRERQRQRRRSGQQGPPGSPAGRPQPSQMEAIPAFQHAVMVNRNFGTGQPPLWGSPSGPPPVQLPISEYRPGASINGRFPDHVQFADEYGNVVAERHNASAPTGSTLRQQIDRQRRGLRPNPYTPTNVAPMSLGPAGFVAGMLPGVAMGDVPFSERLPRTERGRTGYMNSPFDFGYEYNVGGHPVFRWGFGENYGPWAQERAAEQSQPLPQDRIPDEELPRQVPVGAVQESGGGVTPPQTVSGQPGARPIGGGITFGPNLQRQLEDRGMMPGYESPTTGNRGVSSPYLDEGFQERAADAAAALNQMDREQRYQRSLRPPMLGEPYGDGGYRTSNEVWRSTQQRRGIPGANPYLDRRIAEAADGNYGIAAPNEENAMLAPMLPGGINTGGYRYGERPPVPGSLEEMQSGGTRARVPEGTTMGSGSRVAYRPDGRPVLLPPVVATEAGPDATNEELMAAYEHSDSRFNRPRSAGDRGIAYRGNYALSDDNQRLMEMSPGERESELRRRREEAPSNVRTRRENAPLPGYPRLPARMTEQQREASMAQRRRARGLPATLGGEGGSSADINRPPVNMDEAGNIVPTTPTEDLIEYVRRNRNPDGSLNITLEQLQEEGYTREQIELAIAELEQAGLGDAMRSPWSAPTLPGALSRLGGILGVGPLSEQSQLEAEQQQSDVDSLRELLGGSAPPAPNVRPPRRQPIGRLNTGGI